MTNEMEIFLVKAEESLLGAESEFANERYNNCANRCYYSSFQAAIHALLKAGVRANEPQAGWGHAFVQAQFVGQLINRRKLYASDLRDVLARGLILRVTADYEADTVTETRAVRALGRARGFLDAVRDGGGDAQ